MANKKISELESRASLSLSDLMAVGDPSTGYLYKTTISDLKTLTGAGVVSFNGRFGTVNPAEGDYTLTQLGDVIITSATNGQVLQYNGSNWVNSSLNLTTTLAALTDVAITSIANNQLLRYNSTSQKWENWTANYLTAESDTLDTVTTRGATTSNGITVGSVSAAGLSNLLGQIRTFATTGNTYIGASPASASDAGYKLDLNGTARISGDMTMWDDGTNNGNSRALIFRALGSTGNAQTGQIILDGFGAAGQDQLQLSASSIRLSPSTGSVTITGTTPNISTVAASGFRLNANSTTNGFTFTQAYNQTSGDLLAVFTNSNQKKFSIAASDSSVTIASLAGTGSRMIVADANGVLSTQAIPTSAVSSVFGRTGAVVAANGDYTTSQVTEGTNLYYTDARARAAITLTTTGSSGAATYSGGTLNIPTYTLAGLGGQPALSGTGFVKISGTTISYDNSTYLTTSSAASTYLPLAGGTLTGALNGTSGTFSGNVSSSAFIRLEPSANGSIIVGSRTSQTDFQLYNTSNSFRVYNGSTDALSIATGTGAATFSSSVTAGGSVTIGSANTSTELLRLGVSYNVSNAQRGAITWHDGSGITGKIWTTYNGTTRTDMYFGGLYNSGYDGGAILTLSGNGTVTTLADIVLNPASDDGRISFKLGSFDVHARIIGDVTSASPVAGNLQFWTANAGTLSERMRISEVGNVGINCTGVNARLEVAASSGEVFRADAASGAYRIIANQTQVLLNGNVGIGTSAPSQALHVVGNSYISGRLDVGMTPSPFWNARFRDYSDGSGVYIGSVAAGGYKFIAGDSYYENSGQWHSDNTTSAIVNLTGGNFTVYTNSGLTANTNFTPTSRFNINPSGLATFNGDVKVKTLEITNVGTDSTSSGVSTYMRITVNGQNYLIPLHGTP